MCAFDLHLDGSWGYGGVKGDRGVAVGIEEMLAAAGPPDTDMPRRDVHRTALEVIARHFGLSLPRSRVLEAALSAVILEQEEPLRRRGPSRQGLAPRCHGLQFGQ